MEIREAEMPKEILQRDRKKVEEVVPLRENQLLVFFRDGSVKKCDIWELAGKDIRFKPILNHETLFCTVEIQTGGYGVCWGENLLLTYPVLYESGIGVPISMWDLKQLVAYRVVNTAKTAEILDCSRQNINDLIHRDKLHSVKSDQTSNLFLKGEIVQRRCQ